MIPQLPDKKCSKKLREDSSTIAPSSEQCDRMLRNVLSATAQKDTASYTEVVGTLEKMEIRERRHRRRAFTALAAAACFLVVGVSALVAPLLSSGEHIQIIDDDIPLSSGYNRPDPLPGYSTELQLADGTPATYDLSPALRGMRKEDGQLYFYFENKAQDSSWQAVEAESTEEAEIAMQPVAAAPSLVRIPYPAGGLNIRVEDAQGRQAVVLIRSE